LLSLVQRLIVVNVSRAQIELHGESREAARNRDEAPRDAARDSRRANLLGNGIRMQAATSSSLSLHPPRPPAPPGRDAISFTFLAVGSPETDAENHSSRTFAFVCLSLSLSLSNRFLPTGNIIKRFASAIVQIKSLPGPTRFRDRVARCVT